MSIHDIAALWDIEANALLKKIIENFSLKNNYTIDSKIEEIRQEFKFPPSQIKEIAEIIKTENSTYKIDHFPKIVIEAEASTPTTPDSVVSNSAFLPGYNFLEIFIISLFLYFGGNLIFRKMKTKTPRERNFWNTLLLLSFIGSAGTGMILVFIRDFAWFKSINFNFLF